MGEEAQFRFGKRPAREGIEFVNRTHRRSSFRRLTKQAEETAESQSPLVSIQNQQQSPEPSQNYINPDYFTDHNLVGTSISTKPLISEEELPLYKDDDEILGDIPKSKIKHSKKTNSKTDTNQTTAKDKLKVLAVVVLAVLATAVLAVSVVYIYNSRPPVTAGMRNKVGAPIYYMVPNAAFRVEKGSVSVNEAGSFVFITYENRTGNKYVISQQKTPNLFNEDAQYQVFLKDNDKYADFDSAIGKAYLTKPSNLGTDISIVVKTNTTLMFIRGPGATSEQTWQGLIAYLKLLE